MYQFLILGSLFKKIKKHKPFFLYRSSLNPQNQISPGKGIEIRMIHYQDGNPLALEGSGLAYKDAAGSQNHIRVLLTRKRKTTQLGENQWSLTQN